jgi:hypothetical protein
MDQNNNIQTNRTLENKITNERDIPSQKLKHAFIFYAYERDSSPISERVLQRATDKMHMISQEDLTSSFELIFQQK